MKKTILFVAIGFFIIGYLTAITSGSYHRINECIHPVSEKEYLELKTQYIECVNALNSET